ncbi:response regulator transcription factor [Candidatus Hepatobacter penaei]|uniref:response regulator transcription factor n=1 Tax=Candidatus Hepatobacter penaei TaxID=1274402 RepID=UPI000697DA15|nr:response regulator transcription factor [Candidatus Hepatobacter penaei]
MQQPSCHHLLVVDDDPKLRNLLCHFLGRKGFFVSCAEDVVQARVALGLFAIDMMLLDVMLPGEDGFSFLSSQKTYPPVLFLTARGGIEDRLNGLSLGAYDYLPKPFEPEELFLRIQSIVGRVKPLEMGDMDAGPFRFNPQHNVLKGTKGEAPVYLTEGEAELLLCLMRHKNKPLDRAFIAQTLNLPVSMRSIDVRMGRLRAKLGQVCSVPCLQSVRGVGYILKASA